MLKTIQIIALIQGVFLLMILLAKKANFKKLNFSLLCITITSLLFHIIGDDDFNLFQEEANWFFFHSPLIITLFFILIKYHNSNLTKFQKKDLYYFIPYVCFVFLQAIESYIKPYENKLVVIIEGIIVLFLIGYLIVTIRDILKNKKERWMLFFMSIYAIVYTLDAIPYFITGRHDSIPFLESYGIIGISTVLLYVILFKLVVSPKAVLPKEKTQEYKTSSLDISKVENYQTEFLRLMNEEKLFKNETLTVHQVAQIMEIPRQHLSQVLNVYMKSNFQDCINTFRVEEFIDCLKQPKYNQYTIMGIANEVGFKSKSSFYTTFKKLYGVTPSQYKKTLEK